MTDRLIAALLLALCSATAYAQVSLPGGTYSQDFNTLAQTGTTNASSTLPAGWLMLETGTNANTTYSAGTGSGNSGDTFSFGPASNADRALGGLQSGSLVPVVGACFTNNTGSTLTSINIGYTGEQWRLGALSRTTADRLDFQINSSPGSISLAATGTWTDVNTLDFAPPTTTGTVGALDGNNASNRTVISAVTVGSLSIANLGNFCIRWNNVDATGADDGLAIDDFTIAAGRALSINDVSITEGNSGTVNATFTVSLTSPAGAGGVSFNYATADNTATDANNDYEPIATTAGSISSGNSSTTITVLVNGDTAPETNETFFVNLTSVVGAGAGDVQGQGTINNDDIAPNLTINDVSQAEGNSGTTTASFTVSLSTPAPTGGVTFNITTTDNTATDANNDYEPNSVTGAAIAEGMSSYTFNVTVNGDATVEGDETFFVNISNISSNVIATDTQGLGTITNDDVYLVHEIQGSGATSPMVGQTGVSLRAIVIGKSGNAFWVQEEDAQADADPLTSEGLFIFRTASTPAVNVGDQVQVTGTVIEFSSGGAAPLTEIAGTPTVSVLSSGNALPTPINLNIALPIGTVYDTLTHERYEGMRVSSGDLEVVAPNAGNGGQPNETTGTTSVRGDFYVVLGGVARPLREAGIPATELAIVPARYPGYTGPSFDGNLELLRFNPVGQGTGTIALTLDAGDALTNFVGVMDQFQGKYSLLPDPDTDPVVVPGAQIVAVRDADYDEFTVAGANWFRFFDDVFDGNLPTPGDEPVPNGTFYANRLAKASRIVCLMMGSPDVIGSVEVENLNVLQDLAAAIQANTTDCGANPPQYQAYLLTGFDVGGIDIGFLVRTDPTGPNSMPRVEVLDADPGSSEVVLQVGRNTLFKNFAGADVPGEFLNDRPSLALLARIHAANGSSEDVTVVANHLRSLSSVNSISSGTFGYPTSGARVRAKRHQQAVDLATWIEGRQTANPAERIVLVGDFNAFEFNDGYGHSMGTITGKPVTADSDTVVPNDTTDLISTDLTNMTLVKPLAERYSFVFDSNAQSLDHIVVNQSVLDDFDVDIEHARINADFNLTHYSQFGPSDVTRMSDHDPVVLYLQADSFQIADLAVAVAAPASPVKVGKTAQFGVGVSNGGPAGSGATTLTLLLDAANPGMTVTAPAGWSCGGASVVGTITTIECATADVANGTTPSFNVNVPVTDDLSNRLLTITASVAGTTVDTNLDNNSGSDSIATTSEANLRVSFTGPGVAVRANSVTPVTARVDNYGANTAVNPLVSISSNVPAGNLGIVAPSGWTCTATGAVTASFECRTSRMPRSTAYFPMKVTPPSSFAGSTVTFTGSVASDSIDPSTSNNTGGFNLQIRSTPIAPVVIPVN